ncbi:hypothetical protein SBRY_70216 [Actinacidiphila bryophytorum]|uniref:Uncharacterized protein n=1 Tax=Actinacidiphila bryophytorum TaxID=1436133 RepID=A0A9W4MJT1_9ACTN|nr:hypothetical protein SBRY_70216 [Actinacidiphila bryophytorum]
MGALGLAGRRGAADPAPRPRPGHLGGAAHALLRPPGRPRGAGRRAARAAPDAGGLGAAGAGRRRRGRRGRAAGQRAAAHRGRCGADPRGAAGAGAPGAADRAGPLQRVAAPALAGRGRHFGARAADDRRAGHPLGCRAARRRQGGLVRVRPGDPAQPARLTRPRRRPRAGRRRGRGGVS